LHRTEYPAGLSRWDREERAALVLLQCRRGLRFGRWRHARQAAALLQLAPANQQVFDGAWTTSGESIQIR